MRIYNRGFRAETAAGGPIPGAHVTLWDAQTDGTQITSGIETLDGSPIPGAVLICDAWGYAPSFRDTADRPDLWAIGSDTGTIPGVERVHLEPDDTDDRVTALESTVSGPSGIDSRLSAVEASRGQPSGIATLGTNGKVTPAQLPLAASTSAQVNVADYGAAGNGTTDDAPAIQAALDAIAVNTPGARLVFPPGTYLVNSELEIKSSIHIDLSKGATIKRGSSGMQYILKNFNSSYSPTLYAGRGGIRITGGVVDADGANITAACTAIITAHAKGVIIEGVTIRNVVDWHAIELNSTQDAVIRDCIAEGYRPFTTARYYSEAFQIDLAINSSALPGIGSGAYDSTPCDNVLITGCTVRGFGALGAAGCLTGSHSWADGHKHTRIRVIGNYADGLSDYMVNATFWDDLEVIGNVCWNSNSFAAFQLPTSGMTVDMFRAVISNNLIFNSGVANAAPSANAACILIQGNDVSGAGNVVREVTLANNVFHTVGNTGTAITCQNVADLVISGGSMKAMVANGISVKGCRTAVINGVKVAGAGTKAIVIWDGTNISSGGTSITNCVVDNAADHAIDITSQGCTIANNVVEEQVTSGKACLRVAAADAVVVGNNFWRRGGSSSSNGIQVDSGGTSGYFAGNRLKGWATATSTAASGVTGTAVWAISGTAVLDPAIASFTTNSLNKINTTN